MLHNVIDTHDLSIIGSFASREIAQHCAARLNARYGAARYEVRAS